eukprot:1159741-Pelagomonas_calceolata.AAC.16
MSTCRHFRFPFRDTVHVAPGTVSCFCAGHGSLQPTAWLMPFWKQRAQPQQTWQPRIQVPGTTCKERTTKSGLWLMTCWKRYVQPQQTWQLRAPVPVATCKEHTTKSGLWLMTCWKRCVQPQQTWQLRAPVPGATCEEHAMTLPVAQGLWFKELPKRWGRVAYMYGTNSYIPHSHRLKGAPLPQIALPYTRAPCLPSGGQQECNQWQE